MGSRVPNCEAMLGTVSSLPLLDPKVDPFEMDSYKKGVFMVLVQSISVREGAMFANGLYY